MLESQLQRSVIQYLEVLENQHRLVFIRNNSFQGIIQRRNGSQGYIKNAHKGSADIILCVPGGNYVALEIKSDKGKQSEYQSSWQKRLNAVGGMYHIIRSLEDLDVILNAYSV